MSRSGESPKVKRTRFQPQASDPVNPQEGDVFRSNGTARSEGLWEYRQGSWQLLEPDRGGLLVGDNATFDGSIGSWVAYADAAASVPVDGTGGSPTVTVTRTTSSPLKGAGSLLLTKDAVSRQGEGASVTLPVAPLYRGQPVRIKFSYEASAAFVFGSPADPVGSPSDISVFLYDVTNSRLLSTNSPGIFGGGYYDSLVQLPSNCASVRVILHIAGTTAPAWTFKADNFDLDLAPNEFLKADSDWVNYVPTTQGFGTISVNSCRYKINGPNLDLQINFTGGTAAAVEAQVGLPSGYVINTGYSGIVPVGSYHRDESNNSHMVVATDGDAFLNIVGSTVALPTPLLGNQCFSSNGDVIICASVPVKGLTSGYAHPAQVGLNAKVFAEARFAGSYSTGGDLIDGYTNVETIGISYASGVFTVQSPGDYAIVGSFRTTTNPNNSYQDVRVNGASYVPEISTTLGTQFKSIAGVVRDLKYGDEITLVNQNVATTVTNGQLYIYKIGSEAQPYAPRVAYLKDVKANATDGGTFTSGSWQTRDLNTIEGDTSFMSLSSNQFTLQPGTYHIEGYSICHQVNGNRVKLRNITDSTDSILGSSRYASAVGSDVGNTASGLMGTITVSSAKTFEIQHRCSVTKTTNGFGAQTNFGLDEVYSEYKITKVL